MIPWECRQQKSECGKVFGLVSSANFKGKTYKFRRHRDIVTKCSYRFYLNYGFNITILEIMG